MLTEASQNPTPFQYKVRVRVCGILKREGATLLLRHQGIGKAGHLWLPPGGGVEFGQSLKEALQREFLEETNLTVEVTDFLFANEHIDEKHHAVEFFFHVKHLSGDLRLGRDPELSPADQLLEEARYFTAQELEQLDADTLHSAFNQSKTREKIEDLRGLITFKD